MGRGGAASHSGHVSRWGCTSDSNPALSCWANIFSVPNPTAMCLIDPPAPSPSLSFSITSQASCWFCSWTLSLSTTCDCPADLLFIAWVFFCWHPAAPSRSPELGDHRSHPMLTPRFTEALPALHLLVCPSMPPAKPLFVASPGPGGTQSWVTPPSSPFSSGHHHYFCAPALSPCGVAPANSAPTLRLFFLFASFSFCFFFFF